LSFQSARGSRGAFKESTIARLIIETKSGGCAYGDTVAQLSAYQRAIERRSSNERCLIWGVTEQGTPLTSVQMDWLRTQRERGYGDVWAFSSADDIALVLSVMVGKRRREPQPTLQRLYAW
jgi:hypothetical protein